MKTTLLSFFLCYYFIHLNVVVSAKCLQDQQSLLLQFKNNFTFDPQFSTKLKSWNENTACCNWSGVTCDNEGHVIGLDLSEESIYGGFDNSSSLFDLQHLQTLNLAYNNFGSPIPSEFSKLVMLNHLNLSKSFIVGNIPKEISKLTSLVTLDLSSIYSFSKEQGRKISDRNLHSFLQNLTSLKQLYLDGINISTMGHEWGNALLQLRDLQELSMSGCDLSGPLDSSLTKLVNLSVIVLDGNYFASPIPETFSNLKNLTTLNLHDCGLIGTFPQKVFQIKTLSVIDLSGNYNLHGSFPDYSMSESLYRINLESTQFSGTIPHTISNMRFLSHLDLSYCQFNGTLPNSMSNLSHLTYVDLSHNSLSGDIPSSLFTLPSLEEVHLSFNSLNGSLQLDEVLKLRNLTTLDLSYNNISIDVNVANVDLSFVPKFRYLSLVSCNLKSFPSFLINQSTLFSLDLSNNQIQGKIPNWIWKLQDLENFNISHNLLTNLEGPFQNLTSKLGSLDLHNNKLQGSIPSFPKHPYFLDYSKNNFSVVPQYIGSNLSSMEFLSFSHNNLHGSVPNYLCNASQLQILDISFNKFSGIIPPCLLTMTGNFELEVLDLRNNSLTGSIPDMFPKFCFVTRLNFHGNQLQGPIPRSLSHCSFLEVFDIGSNQIVDYFPCFLNEIPTLSVLVLRNNKFHGSIECSENKPWKSIQIVDIAFNNFNGTLPKRYFTTWERMIYNEEVARDINYNMSLDYPYYHDSVTVTCKGQQQDLVKILTIFKAIDFSFNSFEGPIPESLMDLKALYILNFSNNGLSGEIPSSIRNLKQLESLDFSNNSLDGEIPVQLASLTFLSYLNLSFNHLVGKIPTGTQLQSFPASSFEGNDGLYGLPLNETQDVERKDLHPQPTCESIVCLIDWNFLSVELGFVFGLGMIMGPIMFWKKWRVGYWKLADKILCKIFPWMHLEYETHRGQTYTVLRW
ncbi:receptor-like protein 7 [Vicia villosa]|uniref:receptor-like protein 7 n=1 Tax=Vicia villosa TaxID=3911 RepID=UPI00273A85E3|nr:receptor-like protein 7 [Vicia villosa]